MKNKAVAAVMTILMLLCAFTSCIDNSEPDNSQNETAYLEAIELLESGQYQAAYNEFSKLGNYKETGKYLSKFHYVPLTLEFTAEGYDDPIRTTTVFYNSKNMPTKATVSEAGRASEYTYKYDANGNMVEKKSSDVSGQSVYQYTYDASGKCASMTHTLPDGDVYSFEYSYDQSGKLTEARYMQEGENRYTVYYEYDQNGRLIKEATKDDGEGKYLREYTYDKNGNLTKSVYSSYDKTQTYYSYTTTYDENNLIVKKVFTEGSESHDYNFTFNNDQTEVVIATEDSGYKIYMTCKYKLVYIDSDITDEALGDILDDIRLFME